MTISSIQSIMYFTSFQEALLYLQSTLGDVPARWPYSPAHRLCCQLLQSNTAPNLALQKQKGYVLGYVLPTPTHMCLHCLATALPRTRCDHWQATGCVWGAVGDSRIEFPCGKVTSPQPFWLAGAFRVFYSDTTPFHILPDFSFEILCFNSWCWVTHLYTWSM